MLHSLYFYLLLSVCLIPTQSLYAQPAIEWAKSLGGTGIDDGYCIATTFDDGFVVAGSTNSKNGDVTGEHDTSASNSDMWVVKLSSQGTIEWQKTLGGSGEDDAYSIIQTKDSGFAVAGRTTSQDGDVTGLYGMSDFWIVKLNKIGNIDWQKCFGGSDNDVALSIIQTSDNGYAVAGWSSSKDGDVTGLHPKDSTSHYQYGDIWIDKLDSSGLMQWEHTYGGTSYGDAYSIVQTFDGGYAVVGETSSNDGDVSGLHSGAPDIWFLKLSKNGVLEWQRSYGGSNYDIASSVIQTKDSGYAIAGFTSSFDGDVIKHDYIPGYGGSFWGLKLNSIGEIDWQYLIPDRQESHAESVIQTKDGGYAVAGWQDTNFGRNGKDTADFLIIKLKSDGTLEWKKFVGGSSDEKPSSIKQTNEGGFVIAGYTISSDGDVTGYHGDEDFWVVKLLPEKNAVPTSSKFTNNAITLYPNPNNGTGQIEYSITIPFQIRIEIYDAIGKLLNKVADSFEDSGKHYYSFDLSGFPAGQYFIRFQSGNINEVHAFQMEK